MKVPNYRIRELKAQKLYVLSYHHAMASANTKVRNLRRVAYITRGEHPCLWVERRGGANWRDGERETKMKKLQEARHADGQ